MNSTDHTMLATDAPAPSMSPTDIGARLVRVSRQLAVAKTAETYAKTMSVALDLVTPHAERTVSLFVPSSPTDRYDITELTGEALMEVAARFPEAPPATETSMMAWLSATLMDAVYARYVDAKRIARLDRDLASATSEADVLDSSTVAIGTRDDGRDAAEPYAVDELHARRLQRVLGCLMSTDARVLSLRASGASFATMGRLIGVSASTARRQYDRALSAARRVAADLYDHAA